MKKCKVVIVPVDHALKKECAQYPLWVRKSGQICHGYRLNEGGDPSCEATNNLAHIKFCDEDDSVIATTNLKDPRFYIPHNGIKRIPQSFIDEFIVKNGDIKEVMIESNEYNYTERVLIPLCGEKIRGTRTRTYSHIKSNSKGEVIIHPVKTDMNISDIPIEDIKTLIYEAPILHSFAINRIKQWIENNNF